MKKNIIVINLIGGPGVGKSTLASYIYYILKKNNMETELVTEYAKDIIWEKNYQILDNQLYIFANQHHKIWRIITSYINNNINNGIIITDSPLILSSVYYKGNNKKFVDFVIDYSNKVIEDTKNNYKINNLYYFIERQTEFKQLGRKENIKESINIDKKILEVLKNYNIKYKKINPLISNNINIVLNDIEKIILDSQN